MRSMTTSKSALAAALLSASFPKAITAWEESCTQFKDIYVDGTELCEKMWDDSFEVVDDASRGYTMWFFNENDNPNDFVTEQLFGGSDMVPDQCHLQYYHKKAPSPEGDDMTECHPWKNNACCDSNTVQSVDKLNEVYGEGYKWDRCGPMSQACERFFVMESCLYECEPSAGLFRKYNETQTDDPDYNTWQLHKMPIRKSFCDSWYTACANDYFCGEGDFFACSADYDKTQAMIASKEAAALEEEENKKMTGLVIGLIVVGALAVVGVNAAAFLYYREKQGNPVFTPVDAGVST
mmetsp:Transcript_27758/g.52296  ORF Transcript_27758/g.52296 Transcript_27758/m.52296 type:complete len:294 (+) Transcript_27758:70-951(+)